jgi:hypothetical protein
MAVIYLAATFPLPDPGLSLHQHSGRYPENRPIINALAYISVNSCSLEIFTRRRSAVQIRYRPPKNTGQRLGGVAVFVSGARESVLGARRGHKFQKMPCRFATVMAVVDEEVLTKLQHVVRAHVVAVLIGADRHIVAVIAVVIRQVLALALLLAT